MFVYKSRRRYVIGVTIVFVFIAIVLTLATYQITAKADSVSWVAGGELRLVDNSERAMNLQPQQCRDQVVSINDRPGGFYYESGFTTTCVYDAGDWRYALTNQTYKRWPMDQQDVSFALSVGADTKMYRVNNLHPQDIPVYIPQSRSLAYASTGLGWGRILKVYKDIVSRLSKVDADSYTVRDVDTPDFLFKRPNGNLLPVGKVVSSDNGKWLAFEAVDLGIMRLNLETYEIKRVSSVAPQYGLWGTPHMSMAISDNGEYIAIAGENTPFHIYNVTYGCGDTVITDEMTKDTPIANACAMRDIGQYLENTLPSGVALASSLRLSSDAGEIGFKVRLNNDPYGQNQKEYVIQAPGYVPGSRLKYLAMGDSYSSGEGDTQVVHGKKFYLEGTDVEGDDKTPREKCHMSSRSYPFLLKSYMKMADDEMQSVACSGAEVQDDYFKITDYRGQKDNGSPRLSNLSLDLLKKYQFEAIDELIPGRISQLRFIEQYRPLTITLTASGNDVGFGAVLQSCIMSTYYPCLYDNTNEGRAMIGIGIARQHDVLVDLFNQIHTLSPKTKIYMVGYPKFIDSKSLLCAPNVPLSKAERVMINESIMYLNDVIESAAKHSGVKYIDIEDSLSGHKLCEKGTSYVTGLALARPLGLSTKLFGSSEMQESFHPNKNGHILISNAIKKALNYQSLLDYNGFPIATSTPYLTQAIQPPVYFATAIESVTVNYKKGTIISGKYVQKGSSKNIFDVHFGGFKPHSQVTVELHSNPVNLGVYDIDNIGNLIADIAVPLNIPAGFHTLHLIGQSYSGESIDIWQGVEVRGVDGDIDEDSILDDIDKCFYVNASGNDEDHDEIDDACDPLIEEDYQEIAKESDVVLGMGNSEKSAGALIEVTRPTVGVRESERTNEVMTLFKVPISKSNNIQQAPIFSISNSLKLFLYFIFSTIVLYWLTKRYSNQHDT